MTADPLAVARRWLSRSPVLDGHNDLAWELRTRAANDLDALDPALDSPDLQTDLPRLRAGGVGGQLWSVYVPSGQPPGVPVTQTLEQLDVVRRLCERHPRAFGWCTTAAQAEVVMATGRVASLVGMEGGHSIDGSLGVLRTMARLGARYLTLTHNDNVPWADSATDAPALGGLSRFGEEVVREMNRLGMLVDLSHVSPDTMRHALDVSDVPVLFSHSSSRALCDSPRNVPDDVLARLRDNGGVCMVTFVPHFVSEEVRRWHDAGGESSGAPRPVATARQVADHVEHVREVAGLDAVGLGGTTTGLRTSRRGWPT